MNDYKNVKGVKCANVQEKKNIPRTTIRRYHNVTL